jgi:hypothetical protein
MTPAGHTPRCLPPTNPCDTHENLMIRFRWNVPLVSSLALGLLSPGLAFGQGQELPPAKVTLPPPPNFETTSAPVQHPSGELSVYGVRKGMSKYLDKDVRIKGFVVQVYECPEELRKCNEVLAVKAKREAKKKQPPTGMPPKKGSMGATMGDGTAAPEGGVTCRPCAQPHFFIADAATVKLERAMLLVADYPVKDAQGAKAKPLALKAGDPVVVTGTFAMNSITGFAASNGVLIHKRTEDAAGKVVTEGNAVLPPEAQMIQLEGQPPQQLNVPTKR